MGRALAAAGLSGLAAVAMALAGRWTPSLIGPASSLLLAGLGVALLLLAPGPRSPAGTHRPELPAPPPRPIREETMEVE